MDREMEPPGSNSVWSLIESLKGVKSIGSKLIYKKKSSGNHVWMLMCKSGKGKWTVRWNLWVPTQYGFL